MATDAPWDLFDFFFKELNVSASSFVLKPGQKKCLCMSEIGNNLVAHHEQSYLES